MVDSWLWNTLRATGKETELIKVWVNVKIEVAMGSSGTTATEATMKEFPVSTDANSGAKEDLITETISNAGVKF